jgi:hypothetical protein
MDADGEDGSYGLMFAIRGIASALPLVNAVNIAAN